MGFLSPEVRAELDVRYHAAALRFGFTPFTCEDCGTELAVIADEQFEDIGYEVVGPSVGVLSVFELGEAEHTWQRCRAVQGLPDRMS